MAPLTTGELRSLARLFHHGVDGAEEEIEQLARARTDELADVLGVTATRLREALDAPKFAERLAATIEEAARRRRASAVLGRRASVAALVVALRDAAVLHEDGTAVLDAEILTEIASRWASGTIAFGDRGSVSTSRLRAVLGACRRTTNVMVTLSGSAVAVSYRTPASRGLIRLHLHEVVADADTLVVPIGTAPPTAFGAAPLPVVDEAPAPPPGSSPPSTVRPVGRKPVRIGLIDRLVEAALAFALGGTP